MENTSDKSEKVRSSIYLSLRKIALCYPSDVISASIRYRRRNPKVIFWFCTNSLPSICTNFWILLQLTNNEVRNIFELIKDVCEQRLSKVDNSLLVEIVTNAIEESLKASSVPFISADLLPVIGTKYCEEVLNTFILIS